MFHWGLFLQSLGDGLATLFGIVAVIMFFFGDHDHKHFSIYFLVVIMLAIVFGALGSAVS